MPGPASRSETYLQCPRCLVRLSLADAGENCTECPRRGRRVDGIPVLVRDPDALVDDWARQRSEFRAETQATRDAVLAQIAGLSSTGRTRRRLQRLHQGLEQQLRDVESLFEQAGVPPSANVQRRLQRPPGEGVAGAYYDQMHRDWAWSTDETVAALGIVRDVLGDVSPSRMLVLGAGACRLPYDLHRSAGIDTTVALDINPIPFFVARRVLQGDRVPLVEFPRCPRDSESVAVPRSLSCSEPGASGFHLLFADGLEPPVPDGAFDLVFTPWFIDQVPQDLATLIPEIHRVLRDGGCWLNHGPLLYQPRHTQPAHRYREDEVHELAETHGFSLVRHRWDRLLYMESPSGSQGRTEGVATFLARKDGEIRPMSEALPDWLENPSFAVPRWSELDDYQAPHPMFAAVANLVDGTRTMEDIADALVRTFNVPADAALGGVKTCLHEMWKARHP